MILFPVTQLETKISLSVREAESILSESMDQINKKGYKGTIKNYKFEIGCPRYLKIPVSKVQGEILDQEVGSNIAVSIRPTYLQFIFPLIFLIMAFSRITTDFTQFFQITIISIIIVGILMILYRYSVKKDLEFIKNIFTGYQV